MKKKFLEIIKKHGFILVEYETWKSSFDWRNYQISYKNRKGVIFDWFGRVDTYDDDIMSIENRDGILVDFEKSMLINRGGL